MTWVVVLWWRGERVVPDDGATRAARCLLCVCLPQVSRFASMVLPKYFAHSNYASFIRSLHMCVARTCDEVVCFLAHAILRIPRPIVPCLLFPHLPLPQVRIPQGGRGFDGPGVPPPALPPWAPGRAGPDEAKSHGGRLASAPVVRRRKWGGWLRAPPARSERVCGYGWGRVRRRVRRSRTDRTRREWRKRSEPDRDGTRRVG